MALLEWVVGEGGGLYSLGSCRSTTKVVSKRRRRRVGGKVRNRAGSGKASEPLTLACMEGGESIVVSGCEGEGGGGGGGGEKEFPAFFPPSPSPTPSLQPDAFPSVLSGVTEMAVSPLEGAGLAMGVTGSSGGGSGGSSGGDLFGRKKRGRPRKYGPDGMALALTPTSGSPISPVFSDGKRGRGRPPGSGKYQLLAAVGNMLCPPFSTLPSSSLRLF
ncbi:hypothetical protein BHM03_00005046 [Ensete ventricosum]|uniref:Uncharacterized protein n=1 Tax=Ensete ventricosum TaxID=4639 RepID=A0A445MAZ9_ENSVE|nr:hypothetical protein BHM03_00005046 [Ensete ventricosum]